MHILYQQVLVTLNRTSVPGLPQELGPLRGLEEAIRLPLPTLDRLTTTPLAMQQVLYVFLYSTMSNNLIKIRSFTLPCSDITKQESIKDLILIRLHFKKQVMCCKFCTKLMYIVYFMFLIYEISC